MVVGSGCCLLAWMVAQPVDAAAAVVAAAVGAAARESPPVGMNKFQSTTERTVIAEQTAAHGAC